MISFQMLRSWTKRNFLCWCKIQTTCNSPKSRSNVCANIYRMVEFKCIQISSNLLFHFRCDKMFLLLLKASISLEFNQMGTKGICVHSGRMFSFVVSQVVLKPAWDYWHIKCPVNIRTEPHLLTKDLLSHFNPYNLCL